MFDDERRLSRGFQYGNRFNMTFENTNPKDHPITKAVNKDGEEITIRRLDDEGRLISLTLNPEKDTPVQLLNGDPNKTIIVDKNDIKIILAANTDERYY